jgi:hypothetical protein
LHAAVIERQGKATALVGRSGIGKSTAVLLAMAQGWQPVAEDFAWFDPANAHVYGWDRGIRLTEQALAWMGADWQIESWQRDSGGKLLLSYDKITRNKLSDVKLTRVAVLHRDPTRPSAWEPLGLHDSVRALCESAGLPLCRRNREHLADSVARVVKQLEVVRLVVGNTPLPF